MKVNNLVRNCLNSEVNVTRLMTEIILPAIAQIQLNFDEGKIGNAEQQLMKNMISKYKKLSCAHLASRRTKINAYKVVNKALAKW